MPETEGGIPEEARNFMAPENPEADFLQEWSEKFKKQEDWVLEQSIQAWEGRLAIPDSKDNYLMPGAREQIIKQLELAKLELKHRKSNK